MISAGQALGESYRMDRTRHEEIRLTCGKRGAGLAVALGARCARRPRAYFLTPARAEKWRVLFIGGYSARRCRIRGIGGVGFSYNGGRPMALNVAVWQAGLALRKEP